ncbi:class I SAM-dependent methyltransferase [Roseivirga echinicomitans]|uniref:Methyltransferase n=1 Tax=Roseivirga echinicomitans TaxID=296218 RepID=A0A150XQY6_9BACT|nr:class I SAM-dependent methyltransferase [Roseivirga echinicomitans]KYG81136.1 hypothetical protein AWN68_16490 [Roseivirga echinicomitans]
MKREIKLGKLPFYWRMTDKPNSPVNPVPDFVDFSFEFNEDYQLIIQKRNDQTWGYLETIYKEDYNVGYLQEGHDLAISYGGDFLEFIEQSIDKLNPSTKRISEVGAGGCYILGKLKEKGFDVAAIDPSPIAIQAGAELGIEVIEDFYPTSNEMPKTDMIIHYDVLEHVLEPSAFIKEHAKDLNTGGLIAFAVPDCTRYIDSGDMSMILHEHLNYFDQESLRNVVESAGFEVLSIRPADFGGVLYCVAKVSETKDWTAKKGTSKFEKFDKNLHTLKNKVVDLINLGLQENNTLGCYIPLRAMPYLAIADIGSNNNIRFFDDNAGIYNQYFDGFEIKVENFQDVVDEPVTHMVIMSAAFGQKIKNKIIDKIGKDKMVIYCLDDFII